MTKKEKTLQDLELVAEYILDELDLLKRKPKYYHLIKRNIQVKMWDKAQTKFFWTGMISEEALRSGERVKEHWYGATPLALDIMEMETPSVEKIVNLILQKLTWHYTTVEENQKLKFNGQDYDEAGIVLVPFQQ